MNITYNLIFIFISISLCFLYNLVTRSNVVNPFTIILLPIIFSITPLTFIKDYKLSLSFYSYLLINILTLFVLFSIIDITIKKKITWRKVDSQEKLIFFLLSLQIIATVKQIISITKLFNLSFIYIIINRAAVLEEYFLLSGFALLFRFNIPLIIILEFLKDKKTKFFTNRLIDGIQVYLILTTFFRFNKTEPVIAFVALMFSKYLRKKISIKRITLFASLLVIFPFFINYYFFLPREQRNFENVKDIVLEKTSIYLSSQYMAFDYLINHEATDKAGTENFQFITNEVNKVFNKKSDITRSKQVKAGPYETNVFTYFGSFFSEFSYLGYVIGILFILFIYLMVLATRSKFLYVYFLTNLALCFFGNFFAFLIFWEHFIILFIYSQNFKLIRVST